MSERRRIGNAWLRVPDTDDALFVDREELSEDLLAQLRDAITEGLRSTRILVTGERGVGKSIFTRHVLRRLREERPRSTVVVVVEGRYLGYRDFLGQLAKTLAQQVRALSPGAPLRFWTEFLGLLAASSQLRASDLEARAERLGMTISLGADVGGTGEVAALGAKLASRLGASLSWETTRSLQRTTERTVTVTDELLHDGITATLERLAEEKLDVVLFLDDVDQLTGVSSEDAALGAFRRFLDLTPALTLVHIRRELMIEELRRENPLTIEVGELPPSARLDMLRRRLELSKAPPRLQADDWAAIEALAHRTGNPLVLLQWMQGLLLTQAPPFAGWEGKEARLRIVQAGYPMPGLSDDDLDELARLGGADGRLPDLEQLEEKLGRDAVDDLRRLGAILPVRRLQPGSGLRLAPALSLLRG